MTDDTQPEALRLADWLQAAVQTYPQMSEDEPGGYASEVDQIMDDAAAELRRQHTRIAELEAELEAVGGVQALSAAPAGFVPVAAFDRLHAHAESLAARLLAASPTPPAEQQATKETSGGFHVWRDISTAPKDGSHFVATGYNYGLYSEGRHICVAQWFRGCWMETSDWNEASELQHLTHWLPLPSPPDNAAELNDLDVSVSPQQAAPKAAPTWPSEALVWEALQAYLKHDTNMEGIRAALIVGAAPQQEAQEPVAVPRFNCWSTNEGDSWFDHPADSQAIYDCLGNDAKVGDEYELTAGWTSVTARYRITEVVGDGEEYEVECISHPHENSAPQPAPVVGRMSPSKEWLETRLAIADDSDVQAGVPSKNARPCDAPPGCDSHNCHGCDDFKHPSPTPQPAPQQEAQEPAFWMNEKGHTWSHSDWKQFPKHRAKYPIPLYPHFPTPQPAPDCHHRPPCDECAALAAQGGKV